MGWTGSGCRGVGLDGHDARARGAGGHGSVRDVGGAGRVRRGAAGDAPALVGLDTVHTAGRAAVGQTEVAAAAADTVAHMVAAGPAAKLAGGLDHQEP